MALTDPELALLLDALAEDPGDGVYPQVGEELVRRSRWGDAARILGAGLDALPHPAAWTLLARARLELGDAEAAFAAISRTHRELPGFPEAARIELLAMERTGRLAEARERAAAFRAWDPNDVVVQAVHERLSAPEPDKPLITPDPTLTVGAAERFADIGRFDRAIRLYRRMLHHNPGHAGIQVRLRELAQEHPEADEFTRDSTTDMVPLVSMAPLAVVPRLGSTPVPVERAVMERRTADRIERLAVPPPIPEDEITDVNLILDAPDAPNGRRKPRSLINP